MVSKNSALKVNKWVVRDLNSDSCIYYAMSLLNELDSYIHLKYIMQYLF